MGQEDIVVCSHACAKKVILLALDAISGADGPMPYAEWMKLADKSYDRWNDTMYYSRKNIGILWIRYDRTESSSRLLRQ